MAGIILFTLGNTGLHIFGTLKLHFTLSEIHTPPVYTLSSIIFLLTGTIFHKKLTVCSGLLSLAHGQEVIGGTAPPIVPLPPLKRCQPLDLKCASSFNNNGECVDMATITVGTLPALYNLSAGAIDNICGPRISTFPDCCRCLSKATCSHPKCVPKGSRDRRCFHPARDIKRPGWFKVGVCDKKTNCDCLELCKNKRCDQAQGKCLLPEDPKPEGWTRMFVCNKRRKCSCFVPPCTPTTKCTSAGGQCFKRGSAPQGSTFVGSFCNSKKGCYCYKLPVEDCKQTTECKDAIEEGKCYGPREPVPVGAVGVAGVCKDECKCYGKGCPPTRDCLGNGGTCYRKGTEPTGSVITDSICDPNNDCYCYKRLVKDCDQNNECKFAINGGQCYGAGDPVPAGAVEVPGVCKDECRCYGSTKDCEQTEECAAALKGGKCYGPKDLGPAGAVGVPDVCKEDCQCYGFIKEDCEQTKECAAALKGGKCYGPKDPGPVGAVGVPGVCKEDCQCYGFSIINAECPPTKDCFIGGGKCYKRGTEPEGSERIDKECDPNNDCYCYKSEDCTQTEKCKAAILGGRCYGPDNLVPTGAVGVPDVCEDGCKCYGIKIDSLFG